MTNVIVKKSSLHGKGVFAARDFRKGEIVMKWNHPTILSRKELEKISEKEKKFISKYGKTKFILFHAPDRFVNHSFFANTKVKNKSNIATRTIRKGDEITTDYTREGVKIDFLVKEEINEK